MLNSDITPLFRWTAVWAMLFGMCAVLPRGNTADRPVPSPDLTPVPVAQSAAAASAAIAAAREQNLGLVVDVTLGHAGVIRTAKPDAPLPPGRYRLHALVATTPHDHILTQAVALRLAVGDSVATFERRDSFAVAGEMAPVHVDFVIDRDAAPAIQVDWFVGDQELDRERYAQIADAREIYLKQRQAAIYQVELERGPGPDTDMQAGDLDTLALEEEGAGDAVKRRAARSFTAAGLPTYRLQLSGMIIERLTPVSVMAVATDKPAYAAGEPGQISVDLQNQSDAPAAIQLHWTVIDDDARETVLAEGTDSLTLTAGERRRHTVADTFPVAGVAIVGRVSVRATQAGLRAAEGDIPFVMLPPPRSLVARDKRVFAHYMGCWPIGHGPLRWERENEGVNLKHESKDPKINRGGHVRNYALGPQAQKLTPEESADLEIRRAMRIGIDGFAIDAWAGGDTAMKTFDTLIRVAAEKDYPFEVTLCIDPSCGGRLDTTVKWLIDTYGDNPKLGRRDGKPLIFGYFSQGPAWGFAQARAGAETDAEKIALRSSPLGWHLAGAAFRAAERAVGQPVFYQFGYGYFFHPYQKEIPSEHIVEALGTIARYVDAVGNFGFSGPHAAEIAAAVRASGAEWSGGIGMYQKENIPYELYMPLGTEWLEGKWENLRQEDATLPQLITWNDYGENSNIAPGYETRYTLYDLTGYHIQWWKTGKQPAADHDRVYLTYAKYPRDATVWPFAQGTTKPRMLEVLTILPEPATIRLPGRDISFEAPAGYSRRQFPLVAGPVIAEVVRGDQVVIRIESPEPITDRPFRESNGMICYSTEFLRHWQADFGDTKPFLYGEYADDDADGLPNWYEMYWFTNERSFAPEPDPDGMSLEVQVHPVTKWLDTTTMTAVDPQADPDRDGRSNLREYLDRTNPTVPEPPDTP